MRHPFRLLSFFVVAVVALFGHEVLTHQNIGNVAVAYLQQIAPNRPLLPNLQQLLRIGAVQEDNDPLPISLGGDFGNAYRYFFHFDPSLSFTSIFGGLTAGCTSTEWGLQGLTCTATCNISIPVHGVVCSGSSNTTNQYGWNQDLAVDGTGAPSAVSIRQFSYVVHLLEDLGSPPHTRNDMHACIPQGVGLLYCDPFEVDNNGSSPRMPNATVVIDTTSFTTPAQFFSALQTYVSSNYYSNNTTFAPGMPGPAAVAEDNQYLYGDCIQAGFLYGTCETVNGLIVRKIAHKGPLFWACAVRSGGSPTCDTQASIDTTIAQEQFAELGPVVAQHVAAFIEFYAPALNVQFQGSGTGTVTSSPGNGINNCATDCSALFANDGNPITLTANPDSNVTFAGWGQDCSGTSTTTTVTLTKDMTCVATFSPASMLTVQKSGNGTGTVTSAPAGINCGTGCLIQSAPFNGSVLLTAVGDTGSSFTRWSGDCSGTSATATLSVTTTNESCVATFSLGGTLAVSKLGTGTGTVLSVPAGINCGSMCNAPFTGTVQLAATPLPGSTFAAWGGDCSGSNPTTTINVAGNKTCTATFNSPIAVVLNPFGNQNGTVPYNVQVVNPALMVMTPAPADVTVTLLREVFSECSGLLFSSNRTVVVSQGQSSVTFNFDAGHDPACRTLPITTVYTVTNAVLAPSTVLNLSTVPSQQLMLFSNH